MAAGATAAGPVPAPAPAGAGSAAGGGSSGTTVMISARSGAALNIDDNSCTAGAVAHTYHTGNEVEFYNISIGGGPWRTVLKLMVSATSVQTAWLAAEAGGGAAWGRQLALKRSHRERRSRSRW